MISWKVWLVFHSVWPEMDAVCGAFSTFDAAKEAARKLAVARGDADPPSWCPKGGEPPSSEQEGQWDTYWCSFRVEGWDVK